MQLKFSTATQCIQETPVVLLQGPSLGFLPPPSLELLPPQSLGPVLSSSLEVLSVGPWLDSLSLVKLLVDSYALALQKILKGKVAKVPAFLLAQQQIPSKWPSLCSSYPAPFPTKFMKGCSGGAFAGGLMHWKKEPNQNDLCCVPDLACCALEGSYQLQVEGFPPGGGGLR